MTRNINKLITIGLGVLCSILLFVAGVLAVTTRDMSFGIEVNVSPNLLAQVDMSYDGGSNYYTIFNNAKTAVPTSATVNAYASRTGNTIAIDTTSVSSPFYNLNLKSKDSFLFKITNFSSSVYVGDAVSYPNGPALMATATATSIQGAIITQYVYDESTTPENGVQNIKPFTSGANASTAETKILELNFGTTQSALVRVNLDLTLMNYADKEILPAFSNLSSSNTFSFARLTVGSYTTTLVAESGYALPGELEIYVGTTLLVAGVDYTYNHTTGVLTINNTATTQTTGNISIKATAKAPMVSTTFVLNNANAMVNTTEIYSTERISILSTEDFVTTLTADADKEITFVIKVNGTAIANGFSFVGGALTIDHEVITDNIEITASGVEVWDGVMPTANLSYTFSGGSGTELDPYQIATATDLAYLSSNVSAGTDYSLGKYFKQTADILLNNYFMSFDTASGLVLVKNTGGAIQRCIGTGINGTTYNTSTAGTMGTIYTSSAATGTLSTTTAPADLYSWTAIGQNATGKQFKGNFDGDNFTVSGMYINTTSSCQGLFGYNYGNTIQNVGVINSYIKGSGNSAAVCGYNYLSGKILHCYNNGVVNGSDGYLSGIVGMNNTTTIISNCYNVGTIINASSSSYTGGVVGYSYNSATIKSCYNTGTIKSFGSNIGGVAGYNTTANSILSTCYNTGMVTGTTNVGGVVGWDQTFAIVSNSYNTGLVTGTTNVGGVVGRNETNSTVSNSYNTGSVSGTSNIGGVVGVNITTSTVTGSYNTGAVSGTGNQVGGVTGYNGSTSTINNSYNTGAVYATGFNIGGVVGQNLTSIVSNCYNIGAVSSTSYQVGGVVGACVTGIVTNCYNAGNISGSTYNIAGIVGFNYSTSTVSNSYNTGTITGTGIRFGGVVGENSNTSTITNTYNTGAVTGTSAVGTLAGLNSSGCTISLSYYLAGTTAIGSDAGSISNLSAFDLGDQILNEQVVIDSTTYSANTTTLLTALNAYATANDYMQWSAGETASQCPILSISVETGSIGSNFAGGAGTSIDPYQIATAEQLNQVKFYPDQNFVLLNNIDLNPGITFTFTADTGLVTVTNGTNTFYLGTGIKGETGGSAVFDTAASVLGSYYNSNASTSATTTPTLTMPGYITHNGLTVNTWTAIGLSATFSFTGTFNGDNHEIRGLFMNSGSSYQGLFGQATGASIENIGTTNGYIRGYKYIGGIVGYATTNNLVENSYNENIVCGADSYIGGVVGYINSCKVINCYNNGVINGLKTSTGVSALIGGIVGSSYTYSIISSCHNSGNVYFYGSSDKSYVAGIAGGMNGNCLLTDSYNSGSIFSTGAGHVAGVTGDTYDNSLVFNSFNAGSVYAATAVYVGGVVGNNNNLCTVNNCYNTGNVTGGSKVGGIAGSNISSSTITNCYNTGTVTGATTQTGGAVGYNSATITSTYYLTGCATIAANVQLGVGGSTALNSTDSGTTGFTATTESKALLLTNLNNWVSTNNANGDYLPWVADTEVVNSGYPLLAEEWENVVDSAYAGGAGTSIDPYQIANADQLKYFANQVNVGTDYSGTYFILTGHILINNTSNLANWGTQAPTYSWTAIGNATHPFTGIFNGNGFTVSGIYINNTTLTHQGLFGSVSGGTIYNVGVVSSYIKAKMYVGGVVGLAKNSSTIANSYSNVSLYGNRDVGGVAGCVMSSTVANCYANGSLTGTYNNFGGLVGTLTNSSTLANSYNSGVVSNNSHLSSVSYGAILGSKISSTVSNCSYYFNSAFEASTSAVLNCSVFSTGSTIIESLNDWLAQHSTEFVYKGWYINTTTGLPALTETVWNGTVATAFAGGTGTQNDPYLIENGSQLAYLTSVTNNGTDATLNKYYKLTKPIMLNNYTQTFDAVSGLVLVKDPAGTIVACLGTGIAGTSVNTETAGTMGAIYTSAAATGTLTTGTLPADLRTWGQIGLITADKEFQGTFDGNNFAVSGVYINTTSSYQGLFGYNSGVTVQNIGTINGYVKGSSYAGGLIGYNYSGVTINNCFNYNVVCGSYATGGVVGQNNINISINNCYNSGVVSSTGSHVGGIVGQNIENSTVSNSYNTGAITGSGNNVGGVVGYNQTTSTVSSSYNTGTINGTSNYVGGVVGRNEVTSTVTGSYNTGTISGTGNYVGGVVGANYTGSTVSYSYNTGSIFTTGGYIGGVVGRANESSTTIQCYNTGSVSGGTAAGGVVGNNAASGCIVINCYNSGIVSGTGDRVGGVVGANESSNIINSFNIGAVIGTAERVGGVAGSSNVTCIITNCYNIGSVTSTGLYSGSIVGRSFDGSFVNFCYYLTGTNPFGTEEATVANNSAFDTSDQLLNSAVTIGAITYGANTTSLLDILNAWVAMGDDGTGGVSAPWYSNATNNGYPILTDEIWDGTVATAFAGGTGTELDPYLISNGSQLAYLASVTNNGTDATVGKYYKLTKPIMLNNYTQTFDTASGLVLVKDYKGTIVACLGTGIAGTSVNTTTAGTMGAIYTSAAATGTLTAGSIPSDLHSWTAIGYDAAGKHFKGIFNGNEYSVNGIYINSTGNNKGLFGASYGSTIQNIGVVNGFVKGNYAVGGINGRNTNYSIAFNCYNFVTICGTNTEVAGIVANNLTNSEVNNCKNYGVVIGLSSGVGGVVGHNYSTSTVSNCYNTGTVSGTGNVGGVVGYNNATSTVTGSYNTGTVNGTSQYTGGVVGYNKSSTVSNSYNNGAVNVTTIMGIQVGGVVGGNETSAKVINTYNTGTITAEKDNVGGVVGFNYNSSVVINSYNTGTVYGGASNIGGVVGCNKTTSTVSNCYNTAIVDGTTNVGAIVGLNPSGCTVSYSYYLTGTTPIGSGTGANNSAITTSATLLTNLNAWVTANPTTNGITNLAWQIITGVNGGYPVFD